MIVLPPPPPDGEMDGQGWTKEGRVNTLQLPACPNAHARTHTQTHIHTHQHTWHWGSFVLYWHVQTLIDRNFLQPVQQNEC